MGPGGATESIAHFAGYMRIPMDFSRARLDYDGGLAPHDRPWAPDPTPEDVRKPILDDPSSQPFRLAVPLGVFALIGVHHHPLHGSAVVPLQPAHAITVDLPPIPQFPIADFGGGGYTTLDLPVRPDQELIVIDQVNLLHNNGLVLMVPGTDVTALHGTAPTEGMAGLIPAVEAPLPDWLPANSGSQVIIDAVTAHDAATAQATPETAPPLAQGVTIDGVLQPAGTLLVPTVPTQPNPNGDSPLAAESSHNGMHTPGLDAETGGNVAANIASILDDHTQHTGLVVYGNAYTTDAIIQVNLLHSLAQIEVGGPSAALDIVTAGNTTQNAASFATHDLGVGVVGHFGSGTQIHVDRIDGNFYDIKGFQQINDVGNNDTIVQGTTSTFYAVDSGGNSQFNYLPLNEINQNYDLIIVHGSFHASNMIVQQNVLLNDDIAVMSTHRGDTATQSITTGDNTLQNSASIDLYGNQTYQPLSASMLASVQQVEAGKLDPGVADSLHGNGTGTLHVLDITGDFYDVNYISQVNLVSNVDTAVQSLPNTGTTTAPDGLTTTSTETINSGHNQLANLAGIVMVGTTSDFQFVGGQHYDDAILIQANLVSDKSSVTIGDTHTLASEVIAFTGLHDVQPQPQPETATHHSDPTLHQDLFHGMMA